MNSSCLGDGCLQDPDFARMSVYALDRLFARGEFERVEEEAVAFLDIMKSRREDTTLRLQPAVCFQFFFLVGRGSGVRRESVIMTPPYFVDVTCGRTFFSICSEGM